MLINTKKVVYCINDVTYIHKRGYIYGLGFLSLTQTHTTKTCLGICILTMTIHTETSELFCWSCWCHQLSSDLLVMDMVPMGLSCGIWHRTLAANPVGWDVRLLWIQSDWIWEVLRSTPFLLCALKPVLCRVCHAAGGDCCSLGTSLAMLELTKACATKWNCRNSRFNSGFVVL